MSEDHDIIGRYVAVKKITGLFVSLFMNWFIECKPQFTQQVGERLSHALGQFCAALRSPIPVHYLLESIAMDRAMQYN